MGEDGAPGPSPASGPAEFFGSAQSVSPQRGQHNSCASSAGSAGTSCRQCTHHMTVLESACAVANYTASVEFTGKKTRLVGDWLIWAVYGTLPSVLAVRFSIAVIARLAQPVTLIAP